MRKFLDASASFCASIGLPLKGELKPDGIRARVQNEADEKDVTLLQIEQKTPHCLGNGIAAMQWIQEGTPSYMSNPKRPEMIQNYFLRAIGDVEDYGPAIAATSGLDLAGPQIPFSANPAAAVAQMPPHSILAVLVPTHPENRQPGHVSFIHRDKFDQCQGFDAATHMSQGPCGGVASIMNSFHQTMFGGPVNTFGHVYVPRQAREARAARQGDASPPTPGS